jgi:hypothetical protein
VYVNHDNEFACALQLIINCSVLPCLLSLLQSDRKGIRKETCWTISNITAGSRDQLQVSIPSQVLHSHPKAEPNLAVLCHMIFCPEMHT